VVLCKNDLYKEEYVLINGISQYFLHIPSESKEVVIMLHGGPGLANSCLSYYQQPYLKFCNAVYYDQRGAGKTQLKNKVKPDTLSLDILLEDLRQTIEYVKKKYETERIFIVSHSWGTMLGTQYIIKYPHDVTGYIGFGQVVSEATQDRNWYEYVKSAVLKSDAQEDIEKINSINDQFPNIACEEYFKQYTLISELGFKYTSFMINDVFELYSKSPIWTSEDEIQAGSIEAFNKKLYEEVLFGYDICHIKEYQVPIYYILGRHDEMTSSVITAEYFETIHAPKKGIYWIENSGHLIDTDNPSVFFDIIKEIITQQ
jgi:pimeloyl-ACP methyl ester carboxylesterase